VPRISKKDKKVYKCTLCSDRVAVGLEPACVKACPTGCITFGSKDQMRHDAAERVEQLKANGFEQAGLYDPQGVGGTHVMYVLHHADDPTLYSGLPKEPKISPMVRLWKGAAKPLAMAAMAFVGLAGFLNMVRGGASETTAADEEAAQREKEKIHV